jgi:hypothetical protein
MEFKIGNRMELKIGNWMEFKIGNRKEFKLISGMDIGKAFTKEIEFYYKRMLNQK